MSCSLASVMNFAPELCVWLHKKAPNLGVALFSLSPCVHTRYNRRPDADQRPHQVRHAQPRGFEFRLSRWRPESGRTQRKYTVSIRQAQPRLQRPPATSLSCTARASPHRSGLGQSQLDELLVVSRLGDVALLLIRRAHGRRGLGLGGAAGTTSRPLRGRWMPIIRRRPRRPTLRTGVAT